MTAAAIAAPRGTLTVHRPLHDGASYVLTAAAPGVVTLSVSDATDGAATIALERMGARRLIDDLTLVAGLAPTAPLVGLAQALAGSARLLFDRLDELDKTDPTAVDAILATIVAHLRSRRPAALLAGGAL